VTPPLPIVIVLSTFPADQDPEPLARALVDERLAACVNVMPPIRSIYRWEGKIEEASEYQLIMKTTPARLEQVKTRIAQLHPYAVPEIVILTGTAAVEYAGWVYEMAGGQVGR
jgi:periplasmic divalent cation tolerance protein